MNRKRTDYPPNVLQFYNKYTSGMADAQARAFWKMFRKAANAYVDYNATEQRDITPTNKGE